MIQLEAVTKTYRGRHGVKEVLRGVSCTFERGQSVGILGLNGAGKSTLMRIMDGTDEPTSGWVSRTGRISRLGLSGGFSPALTGEENVTFVSQIYGEDTEAVLSYVEDFAELGDDIYRPVETYSSGMKARLRLGLSLAMEFDIYLIDEGLIAGDARFQERCRREMKEKLTACDVIMVAHHPNMIRQFCTHAAILNQGLLSEIMELDRATAVYQKIIAQ